MHHKAGLDDDWSRWGTPDPSWDSYTGVPLISWPRFDLTDTSYAIAVLADLTPAWRELYVEILDALLSRYVTWWGALDWMTLKGRDPHRGAYPEEWKGVFVPAELFGDYRAPGWTGDGIEPWGDQPDPIGDDGNLFYKGWLSLLLGLRERISGEDRWESLFAVVPDAARGTAPDRRRASGGAIILGRVPKLIYSFLASLDGYIADDAGSFDWAVPDEEVLEFLNAAERDVGTYLYGRTMYEMMTGWENDPAVAAQSPKSAEFAQIWQAAEKVVFSRSMESVSTKRTRIERSFDPGLVREIKADAGHDLNVSGADLASSAWHAGLIDECHVFVAPMLVGGGKQMFPNDLRQPLKLLEERRFGNGMVFLRYAVSL